MCACLRHKRGMNAAESPLPPELELAIAHSRPDDRAALKAMFELDRNLGRAVAQASEAIVGQLRLAWWRDAISAPLHERPTGNPLVNDIGTAFGAASAELACLVDGWEAFLLAERLDESSINPLLEGREKAWLTYAGHTQVSADFEPEIRRAARLWSIADLAAGVRGASDRAALVAIAGTVPAQGRRLPSRLRGLAILQALAGRSLKRGGGPLLSDRGAALTALRSIVLGR